MRKNQISVSIEVPDYVNLKLHQDIYEVSIALPIPSEIIPKLADYTNSPFIDILSPSIVTNRKFYCIRIKRAYTYEVPFLDSCFIKASRDLTKLKILIRKCKCSVLEEEIENLE